MTIIPKGLRTSLTMDSQAVGALQWKNWINFTDSQIPFCQIRLIHPPLKS
jgi:hypothetical protein